MARQSSGPNRNSNLRNRAGGGRRRIQIEETPWWQRKAFLWTFGILLALVLLINWLIISGWFTSTGNRIAGSYYQHTAAMGLKVEEIYITGRVQTSAADVMAALNVNKGDPILAIDLEEAHTALKEIAWIDSVRIERHLPNVLYVAIKERTPYARWQYQKQLALIDKDGVLLTQRDVDRFGALPLVVGDGANKHAAEILDEIQAVPAFASNLKAAIRVSNRRWDLRLNNGMTLRLPENGMAEALQRLNKFWQTTDIASRNVRVIDARLPDRVIIDEHKPEDGEKTDKDETNNVEAPL